MTQDSPCNMLSIEVSPHHRAQARLGMKRGRRGFLIVIEMMPPVKRVEKLVSGLTLNNPGPTESPFTQSRRRVASYCEG